MLRCNPPRWVLRLPTRNHAHQQRDRNYLPIPILEVTQKCINSVTDIFCADGTARILIVA
jgi:hypothetical protein